MHISKSISKSPQSPHPPSKNLNPESHPTLSTSSLSYHSSPETPSQRKYIHTHEHDELDGHNHWDKKDVHHDHNHNSISNFVSKVLKTMLQNSTNILALLTVLIVVIIILKMFVSAIIESRRNQKMEEARGYRASMINTERVEDKYGGGKRSTATPHSRLNSRTSYGSMITRSSLKTRNHKLSSSSSETSQTNTNNSSQKTSCSLNSTPSIIISDTEDSNKDNILLIDHSRSKGSGRSRNLPSINFQLGTLEEEEDSSC